jgi:hypothetical protein
MTTPTSHRSDRDSGAALLLAIGFVLMISAISGGLIALAISSLNNRGDLEQVRNRQYAADGAIEKAISDVRGATCASPSGVTMDRLNSMDIRVDWTNACGVVQGPEGTVLAQRNVVFSACVKPQPDGVCPDAAIIIRAQVNFEQGLGAVTKTYVQSWSVNR